MKEKLEQLLAEGKARIEAVRTEPELQEVKALLLGKQGSLTGLLKELPKLDAALCETAGQFAYVFAIGANAIVAAPMISSYCIMSLVWSRIFLKEKLSKAQYAVIAVAAVGIAILGME